MPTKDKEDVVVSVDSVNANKAPSFTPSSDITIGKNIGAYSRFGWASDIDDGDEGVQGLHFELVSNSNVALFSDQPSISYPSGTLRFAPVRGQTGIASVGFVLVDDGGVANGGQDTSAVYNLTISIVESLSILVDGNVISWPDNGWYQVQEEGTGTYTEICAGVRSCEVAPGSYIVINHTTGERFKGIEVVEEGGDPSGVASSISVDGNVISWPDNGWYQVQEASTGTYTEVCAGVRSCEVVPGSYIVINHTTGERFKGIEVVEESGVPSSEASFILVDGNEVSWPDNGWYQVQEEGTYTEVCAGVRSCEVVPGFYIVINHTTGERFEGIEVVGR